jgi:hypothetical protein
MITVTLWVCSDQVKLFRLIQLNVRISLNLAPCLCDFTTRNSNTFSYIKDEISIFQFIKDRSMGKKDE